MESRTVIAITLNSTLQNDLVMRTTAYLLWIRCPADGAIDDLPASGLVYENPYPREHTVQHCRAEATIAAATHMCYIVPVLDDDKDYVRAGLRAALDGRKQKKIGDILILTDGDISDIVNSVLTEEDVKGERKKKGEKDSSRIEDMHAFKGKHFLIN